MTLDCPDEQSLLDCDVVWWAYLCWFSAGDGRFMAQLLWHTPAPPHTAALRAGPMPSQTLLVGPYTFPKPTLVPRAAVLCPSWGHQLCYIIWDCALGRVGWSSPTVVHGTHWAKVKMFCVNLDVTSEYFSTRPVQQFTRNWLALAYEMNLFAIPALRRHSKKLPTRHIFNHLCTSVCWVRA